LEQDIKNLTNGIPDLFSLETNFVKKNVTKKSFFT